MNVDKVGDPLDLAKQRLLTLLIEKGKLRRLCVAPMPTKEKVKTKWTPLRKKAYGRTAVPPRPLSHLVWTSVQKGASSDVVEKMLGHLRRHRDRQRDIFLDPNTGLSDAPKLGYISYHEVCSLCIQGRVVAVYQHGDNRKKKAGRNVVKRARAIARCPHLKVCAYNPWATQSGFGIIFVSRTRRRITSIYNALRLYFGSYHKDRVWLPPPRSRRPASRPAPRTP